MMRRNPFTSQYTSPCWPVWRLSPRFCRNDSEAEPLKSLILSDGFVMIVLNNIRAICCNGPIISQSSQVAGAAAPNHPGGHGNEGNAMYFIVNVLSLRPAPDVSVQPAMLLTDWRVIAGQGGDRFLLGLLSNQKTLRITTAIQTVDPVTRTWRTLSGRFYETPSPPTQNLQLQEKMRLLVCADGIHGPVLDVTDDVWTAMQSAVQ